MTQPPLGTAGRIKLFFKSNKDDVGAFVALAYIATVAVLVVPEIWFLLTLAKPYIAQAITWVQDYHVVGTLTAVATAVLFFKQLGYINYMAEVCLMPFSMDKYERAQGLLADDVPRSGVHLVTLIMASLLGGIAVDAAGLLLSGTDYSVFYSLIPPFMAWAVLDTTAYRVLTPEGAGRFLAPNPMFHARMGDAPLLLRDALLRQTRITKN